jgi:uncharacterized delta-60 repeat protein
LARLGTNGALDSTFGAGGLCSVPFDLGNPQDTDTLNGLALQSDGKILAAGTVQTGDPANDTDFGIARLLPNCALDLTFAGDGKAVVHVEAGGATGDGNQGNAVVIHGGRTLVVGTAEKLNVDTDFALARLTSALIFRDGFEHGLSSW